MDTRKRNKRYTKPVVCDRNGNLEGRWYVEYYFDGKRYQVYSGKSLGIEGKGNRTKNKRERKLYFQDVAKALLTKLKNGWSPVPSEKYDYSVEELLLKGIILKNSDSKETNKEYCVRIKRFIAYLQNHKIKEIENIDKNTITTFLEQYKGHNYNNYLRVIKAVFAILIDRQFIKKNPTSGIKKIKAKTTIHKTYSKEMMKKIIDYVERYPYLKIILLLEYYQFARPSEIRRIKTEHIKFDEKKLILIQKKGDQERIRIVPLHPKVEVELRAMDLTGEYLFKNRKKSWIRASWNRLRKKLNLEEGYTIYGFKHTGVCNLYQATKDIYLVSKLCGHSSIKTTEIYLRSLGQDVNFLDNSQIPEI